MVASAVSAVVASRRALGRVDVRVNTVYTHGTNAAGSRVRSRSGIPSRADCAAASVGEQPLAQRLRGFAQRRLLRLRQQALCVNLASLLFYRRRSRSLLGRGTRTSSAVWAWPCFLRRCLALRSSVDSSDCTCRCRLAWAAPADTAASSSSGAEGGGNCDSSAQFGCGSPQCQQLQPGGHCGCGRAVEREHTMGTGEIRRDSERFGEIRRDSPPPWLTKQLLLPRFGSPQPAGRLHRLRGAKAERRSEICTHFAFLGKPTGRGETVDADEDPQQMLAAPVSIRAFLRRFCTLAHLRCQRGLERFRPAGLLQPHPSFDLGGERRKPVGLITKQLLVH